MREVHIRPVLNGFLVTVGCQNLVFESIENLAAELVKYQKAPRAVEKSYLANAVNKGPATEVPMPTVGAMRPVDAERRPGLPPPEAQEERPR